MNINLSNQAKGTLFCALGAFVVSPNALLVRKLEDVDPFAMQFYSYIIYAGAVGIVIACIEGRNTPRKFKSIGWLGLLAGLVYGALLILLTIAFQKTAAANALVILAANPMFSAALSYFILKETIPIRTIIASLACFGAIVLIFATQLGKNSNSSSSSNSSGSNQVEGIVCALAASFLMAAYFIILSYVEMKYADQKPDMLPCVVISGLFGAYIAMCTNPNFNSPQGLDILYLSINGALVLGVSQVFYTWGPSLISAPEVSLYTLLETVLGPLWVWLGGYEAPPVMSLYGGAALILALAIHSLIGIREESRRLQQQHARLPGENEGEASVENITNTAAAAAAAAGGGDAVV